MRGLAGEKVEIQRERRLRRLARPSKLLFDRLTEGVTAFRGQVVVPRDRSLVVQIEPAIETAEGTPSSCLRRRMLPIG